MKLTATRTTILFALLGGLLVGFIALPLLRTLTATSLGGLRLALQDPQLQHSLGVTFGGAALATTIGLLTAVPLAYLLARRRFRGRGLVEAVVMLPVIVPHTAAGVALLLVFGRYGLMGQAFARLGVTFTDSVAGIVLAMLFVSAPFLVTASREAFALVDTELERVALSDGASPLQAFWHVTVPLARRGILAGALMMWARGISEFGAVVILAYHPKVMTVLVYERLQGFGLEAALPATAVLILVALLAIALLRGALGMRREAPAS